jgi:dipeptidyl aminopeptidase/acylaminoacyl peptidase
MKLRRNAWRKRAAWSAAGLLGGFLLANLVTSAYISRNLVRPRRKKNRTSDLTDFTPELRYETYPVRFYTSDGIRISALLLEPESSNGHAIIVCHGFRHNKNSAVRFVQYLIREGYTLLLVDFRNHGESDGDITSYGYYEKNDLHGAVDFLKNRVQIPGEIGILGASMGASIALIAASENKEVKALVLDSPFSSLKQITIDRISQITHLPKPVLQLPMRLAYGWMQKLERIDVPAVEPGSRAKDIECPLFLIHGAKDDVIPVGHSRTIFDNVRSEKELWIVEQAGHLGSYPADPAEYQTRVLNFFQKNLNRVS